MIIPQKFRIGTKRYKIEMHESHPRRYGSLIPEGQRILLYRVTGGKPNNDERMSDTFWHEVTHAILWEMDDPRWKDEVFVKAFSKRLNQVCLTAEVA
jgi:hypothetical protein